MAAVKPVLPLPVPLMPIRLPPLSMKAPAASVPVPALLAKLPAMIVFSAMTAEPAVFAVWTPPPTVAKLPLMVSLRSNSEPVKAWPEAIDAAAVGHAPAVPGRRCR